LGARNYKLGHSKSPLAFFTVTAFLALHRLTNFFRIVHL
jgi:hypothetical protein